MRPRSRLSGRPRGCCPTSRASERPHPFRKRPARNFVRMPETGLRACFENSGCGWLGGGAVAGEAAGHDDDHGPVDVGFVMGGQSLAVADDAAVPGAGSRVACFQFSFNRGVLTRQSMLCLERCSRHRESRAPYLCGYPFVVTRRSPQVRCGSRGRSRRAG